MLSDNGALYNAKHEPTPSIRYQVDKERRQQLICTTSDHEEGRKRAEEALDQMRAAWNTMSLKEAERDVYKLPLPDRLKAWMDAQGVTPKQLRAALRMIERRA